MRRGSMGFGVSDRDEPEWGEFYATRRGLFTRLLRAISQADRSMVCWEKANARVSKINMVAKTKKEGFSTKKLLRERERERGGFGVNMRKNIFH